ncbi:hypothetical protein EM308_01045 [Flavobacterium gilvum]|uniref:SusD/RagB family nutrient-binding outer membrane lipoprotein n=2 Tax=Flavobacterium gilvum TaxID=1492737 RepID=A0AAC9I1E5_9FLAO|nr:hypothetical protein EM308_01045 [Flavobacterium gilvum]KFC59296.1 hypothetical protein FEM08_19000 [Flavobacterium gilvum]
MGCSTDLDINKDPDNLDPDTIPMASQLPAGIIGIVGAEGGIFSIIGGFWAQYYTQSSAANQFKNIDSYTVTTNDYNYAWNSMYDGLADIKNVQRRALAEQNWNYYLIATTLYVQAQQVMTDFYGDIPYTEACDPKIATPKFNKGEEVYDLMIADLDAALAKDLTTSQGTAPGKDDFIFGGKMQNWKNFANTLKLKIYMRQTASATRGTMALNGIKALLSSGVPFLDTDAAMANFTGLPNYENPLYEFNFKLNVRTNMRLSKTLGSFLDANADPRKDAYVYDAYAEDDAAKTTKLYIWQDQGNYGANTSLGYSDPGPKNASIADVIYNGAVKPVYLLSKEESLFLQAEALERAGQDGSTKYTQAITANFAKYGLTAANIPPSYAYPTGATAAVKLEAIITQKWAASFPENGFEAFFEQNRTGFPKISAVAQNNPAYVAGQLAFTASPDVQQKTLFPKRIPYPLSERNANPNVPALKAITDKIWWNQ